MKHTLFCFGYGYSAQTLSKRLQMSGWRVSATVRSQEKAELFKNERVQAVPLGANDLSQIEASHWLISAPPSENGCPALAALADNPHRPEWIGYLSTTGVYGDLYGGWAFEDMPVNPQNKRSTWRAAAEQDWLKFMPAAQIFRLAGIYGPGRSALDRVREGRAQRIVKPGQIFSRVHVEDIAGALLASIQRPNAGRIYNICDDDPAPPQDVVTYAAELLGVSLPPEVDFHAADLSPMAKSFYAECKRVSNARAKAELDWRPVYPSYRDGLRAICSAS